MRAADLAAKLPGVRRRGEYYDTTCPAHPDHDPSLSFSDGDVAIRFLCRSGCTHEAVATAMAGLVHCEPKDFFFERNGHAPDVVFSYTTHEGEVLYQVVKINGDFKLRRPDPQHAERWIWNMQGVTRIVYNLPDLLDAALGLYVEGERDAETCRGLGLVATTHVGGAKGFKPEYARRLKQAMRPDGVLAVLRDEDEPGIALQAQVLAACHAEGLAVKQIILPGLVAGSGADITDWINEGHRKAELLALIDAAPRWTPETAVNVEAELFGEADPFGGEPQPVEPALLAVPPFKLELLPTAFAPFVRDIAERLQCPPDFAAVTVTVCAASVIGRQVGIRPKVYDDWVVVPNVWGANVGPPGVMKSPAMKEAKKPLGYLVAIANKDFKAKRIAGTFEEIRLAGKRKNLTDAIKKAETSAELDALRSQFEALDAEALVVTRRRYETNDATIEKLGMMMNENPNGILLFCDELSYWFQGFEREGHQQDRAFWEKAWMGNSDGSVDRVGRGELYVEACCGSILGGIQPGPLTHWLRDTFGSGRDDDGLAQRFQLAVYPDIGPWEDVQRRPDTEARRRVYEIFERLATLDHQAIGAHKPEIYEDALPYFRFTPEAQVRWDAWYGDLERALHQPSDEHPVIVNHLAKYPSLLASLALVDHVVDCVAHGRGGPINEASFARAFAWVQYLEPHARRIYACVSDAARSTTAALAVKLREGKLLGPFTARDVTQRDWSGLTDRDAVSKALARLEGLHWLRKEDQRGPGRPTKVYHLNPKVTATWP